MPEADLVYTEEWFSITYSNVFLGVTEGYLRVRRRDERTFICYRLHDRIVDEGL
jgi:hypothetical protein